VNILCVFSIGFDIRPTLFPGVVTVCMGRHVKRWFGSFVQVHWHDYKSASENARQFPAYINICRVNCKSYLYCCLFKHTCTDNICLYIEYFVEYFVHQARTYSTRKNKWTNIVYYALHFSYTWCNVVIYFQWMIILVINKIIMHELLSMTILYYVMLLSTSRWTS